MMWTRSRKGEPERERGIDKRESTKVSDVE